MNPSLAAVIVIALATSPYWLPRFWVRVWRRCRCGTQYCTGCGTKRNG
jgi:hypothetical protein